MTNVTPFESETLNLKFDFEAKENVINGIKIGIIKGLASTFDLDRGDDIILPGAFSETLKRHKNENRPVRMLFQHNRLDIIGQFPIDKVRETNRGLEVEGEVNLEVQKGREAFALARQGVLSDFSIGFSVQEEEFREGKRLIKSLELWEISPVGEPMNPFARIEEVKGATSFSNLPLASVDRPWDGALAQKRVADFTNSAPGDVKAGFRRAFFWFDSQEANLLGSYKLGFADVVEGSLKAIPRGIFAAAGAMRGARSPVKIPENDRPAVISHINKYYAKMDLPSPFNKGYNEIMLTLEDVNEIKTIRDFESVLKNTGSLSNKAIDWLAHFAKFYQGEPESDSNEGEPQSGVRYDAEFYETASKELKPL